MARFTYYGHSAVALEDNGVSILIDPFLRKNPAAPKDTADTVQPQYIVVTHAHSDHLGDAIEIALRCKAKIISVYEICGYAAKKWCEIEPLQIGGSVALPFGRVKLTPAFHGSTLEENGQVIPLGNPCGVVISLGEKHIYHAGDTGLFGDMRLIGEDVPLDLALLPIGDRFTMGVRDAVKAAGFLNAKLTVPIHYSTWPPITADPNEFVRQCEAGGHKAQMVKPGSSLEF